VQSAKIRAADSRIPASGDAGNILKHRFMIGRFPWHNKRCGPGWLKTGGSVSCSGSKLFFAKRMDGEADIF
jgi:hypothetical protein